MSLRRSIFCAVFCMSLLSSGSTSALVFCFNKPFSTMNDVPCYQSCNRKSFIRRFACSMMSSKSLPINMCDRPMSNTEGEKGWCMSMDQTTKRVAKVVAPAIAVFAFVISASAADPTGSRDISGQDWSSGNHEQQDFTGVVAVGTNFQKSNLQGSIFNKANLINADFSGADIRGASFAGSILDGTILKDVNAVETIFSESILDVGTIENADLTDSLWPSKLQIMLCDMPTMKGTSASGVNTRESILCSP